MWSHAIACDMNLCMSHDSYIHTLTLNYFWTAVTHTHTPQSPTRTRVWHTPVYTPQKNMAQKQKAFFFFCPNPRICMHPCICFLNVTHWYATWICGTWCTWMHQVRHDSFMCHSTLSCVIPLICLWHELIHVTRVIHTYITTHLCFQPQSHTHSHRHPVHTQQKKKWRDQNAHTPRTYTPKTKQWHWTKISFSSSVLIHASARTPVFHFFVGADMEGSSLKETYNEPQFKRALLPPIKCTLFAACVTWLIRSCDVTHSCVTWPIHSHEMAHSHVTWLIHVWHYSFIRDMTQLFMCHDSFMCDMTHR